MADAAAANPTATKTDHQYQTQSTLADSLRALRESNSTTPKPYQTPDHLRAGLEAASSARRKAAPSPVQLSAQASTSSSIHDSASSIPPGLSPTSTHSSITSDQPRSPRERLKAFLASESLHKAPAQRAQSPLNPDATTEIRNRNTSAPLTLLSKSTNPGASDQSMRKSSAPTLPTESSASLPVTPITSSAMSITTTSASSTPASQAGAGQHGSNDTAGTRTASSYKPGPDTRQAVTDRSRSADQNLPDYIAAQGGNAELALAALWKERQSSNAHSAQLWRLVEKQRAMILGLNKDLEKALKDKERYRKKLKQQLTSEAPPANNHGRVDSGLSRRHSRSPAPSDNDQLRSESALSSLTDNSCKVDAKTVEERSQPHAQSPKDVQDSKATNAAATSVQKKNVDASGTSSLGGPSRAEGLAQNINPQTNTAHQDNVQPRQQQPSPPSQFSHPKPDFYTGQPKPKSLFEQRQVPGPPTVSLTSPTPILESEAFPRTPITSTGPISPASPPPQGPLPAAPKALPSQNYARKAPPAPLNLSRDFTAESNNPNSLDAGYRSDSDYEDVLETTDDVLPAPSLQDRGRRKTREEDDELREVIARKSEDERSSSKKAKKAKSKAKADSAVNSANSSPPLAPTLAAQEVQVKADAAASAMAGITGFVPGLPASPRLPPGAAGSINALLSPTGSQATVRSLSSVPGGLMSPGLPSSPRPPNMAGPRPPVGLPMSPRAGMQTFAGASSVRSGGPNAQLSASAMPLSPRAPTKPIPLPPMSPLGADNPHLQRAEQHAQQSIASTLLHSPPDSDVESVDGSPSTIDDEVYQGFVDDNYPGLLLPPNALPHINVRVFSSRMRPSRNSILIAKFDENPVFQLGIYSRASKVQLWRVEKTTSALAKLHQILAVSGSFKQPLPDRDLFNGHAPAKIDARREALNAYFGSLLDTALDERSAVEVCRFFSEDAIEPEQDIAPSQIPQFPVPQQRPQGPVQSEVPLVKSKADARKEGFLTKRGKNFGGWKSRYFVLEDSALTYFDGPGGNEIGRIKLSNAQIGKQQATQTENGAPNGAEANSKEDDQYLHAFLILEPKRKDEKSLVRHVLCAESDAERDAWVEALMLHVDQPREFDESMVSASSSGGKSARASVASKKVSASNHGSRYSPAFQSSRGRAAMEARRDLSLSQDDASSVSTRSRSRGKDSRGTLTDHERTNSFQSMSYDNMVAMSAPIQGPARSDAPTPPSTVSTPDPHSVHIAHKENNHVPVHLHPTISGPSGGMKIEDASMWGNKAPTTKEKKRSIFAFRNRMGSDVVEEAKSTSSAAAATPAKVPGRAVFGVPLQEAVEYTKPHETEEQLPAVVYRCIEYLREHGAAKEEGIFRLSGSNVTIRALKERFNTERDIELTKGDYYDVHAVASLLKMYLRELPSSVIVSALADDFKEALAITDKYARLQELNHLVHRLPAPNLALLRTLFIFLNEIVGSERENKMSMRNVAIVFVPTLQIGISLITVFLEDFRTIFGDRQKREQEGSVSAMRSGGSVGSRETLPAQQQQQQRHYQDQQSRPAMGSGAAGDGAWDDIRSPRRQAFQDLPTPAPNQQSFGDTGLAGFAPVQRPGGAQPRFPSQREYGEQQQGGYASMNGAMQQQGLHMTSMSNGQQQQQQQQQWAQGPNGQLSAAESKRMRRESNMQMLMPGYGGNAPLTPGQNAFSGVGRGGDGMGEYYRQQVDAGMRNGGGGGGARERW